MNQHQVPKKKLPHQKHSSTMIGTNSFDSIIIFSTGVIGGMVRLVWERNWVYIFYEVGTNFFNGVRDTWRGGEGKVMMTRTFLENIECYTFHY